MSTSPDLFRASDGKWRAESVGRMSHRLVRRKLRDGRQLCQPE